MRIAKHFFKLGFQARIDKELVKKYILILIALKILLIE